MLPVSERGDMDLEIYIVTIWNIGSLCVKSRVTKVMTLMGI